MSNKHKAIGVLEVHSGEITIHASAELCGNYHTLCGLSLDDSEFTPHPIAVNARIECKSCYENWKEAKKFRASNFIKGIAA